jgi:hypothetical protein
VEGGREESEATNETGPHNRPPAGRGSEQLCTQGSASDGSHAGGLLEPEKDLRHDLQISFAFAGSPEFSRGLYFRSKWCEVSTLLRPVNVDGVRIKQMTMLEVSIEN